MPHAAIAKQGRSCVALERKASQHLSLSFAARGRSFAPKLEARFPFPEHISTGLPDNDAAEKNQLNAANCEDLCIFRISGVECATSREETPRIVRKCATTKKLDRTFL